VKLPPRSRNSWRAIKRWSFRVLVVILSLALISHLTLTVIGGSRLRNTLAKLEWDGLPMRLEEVLTPVPPENNAATEYESAFILLAEDGKYVPGGHSKPLRDHWTAFLDGGRYATFEAMDENERSLALSALDRDDFVEITALLEEGSHRDACRFNNGYERGFSTYLPNITYARALARLLTMKIRLLCHRGRMAEAAHLSAVLVAFARHGCDNPFLIEQFVATSLGDSALRLLKETVHSFPAPGLAEVAEALDRMDNIAPMIRAMDAERILVSHYFLGECPLSFDDSSDGTAWKRVVGWVRSSPAGSPWRSFDHDLYLNRMATWRSDMIANPYGGKNRTTEQPLPWYAWLSNLVLPATSSIDRMMVDDRLHNDLARIAVALARSKLDTGAYPRSLADLCPRFLRTIPIRVDDGNPFEYQATVDGFVLRTDAAKHPLLDWSRGDR
jgi:hypothetical protein